MLHTIQRAAEYYHHEPDIWKKLQERGMGGDYSWSRSARRYLELYESLFREKPEIQEEEPGENPVVVDI